MNNRTTIRKSDTSPTGYEVTFYYYAPELDNVYVSGDWMFSEQHHSCRWNSARIWPQDWTKECFPHTLLGLKQTPESLKDKDERKVIDPSKFIFDLDILRLGIYEMKKEETGYFTITIPLPSGTYNYKFIISMPDNNLMMAKSVTDPLNPPYETREQEQPYSQVHIPFDAEKQVDNRDIELPYEGEKKGRIDTVYCEAHYGPQGYTKQPLNIYVPYGYNKQHQNKYPVLYLTHGGSGAVSDWVNQGALANIMDHLIAAGQVEAMFVVMMDNEVFQWKNETACIPNLMESIIPFVEQEYSVSGSAGRRAFAGFSAGGFLSFDVYAYCKDFFGYYGIWSGGQRTETDFTDEAMHRPVLHLGGGRYDDAFFSFGYPLEDRLDAHGIAFSSYWPEGGHQWSVWRKLLEDFTQRVLWK